MSNSYMRLDRAPMLAFRQPLCDACVVDVVTDDDGWMCPSCGTSWGGNQGDGDTGMLYEDWAGEPAEGPESTVDDAWLARR